ncbi:MAG TPA: hypothetical protein PLL10_01515, partial [Elusimicrobiales bacterium]|nr:hypothetical protein [Elusimicrobiales bacterium]
MKVRCFALLCLAALSLPQPSFSAPRQALSPQEFAPALSVEKKEELLKRYVSGITLGDQNLQPPPKGSWRDFNVYVFLTAPFFDEQDRKRIIAEVAAKAPGQFFKDVEVRQSAAGLSVVGLRDKLEISAKLRPRKPRSIDKQDMWPVLYHYLETLKPANGEFSYPPVSYRYQDMDKERLSRIAGRVRPDFRPDDLELEDAVSFLERKGFFSGEVSLSSREFARSLDLNRFISSLRRTPITVPDRTLESFLALYQARLAKLRLNSEELARLNSYLLHWEVIGPVKPKERPVSARQLQQDQPKDAVPNRHAPEAAPGAFHPEAYTTDVSSAARVDGR